MTDLEWTALTAGLVGGIVGAMLVLTFQRVVDRWLERFVPRLLERSEAELLFLAYGKQQVAVGRSVNPYEVARWLVEERGLNLDPITPAAAYRLAEELPLRADDIMAAFAVASLTTERRQP